MPTKPSPQKSVRTAPEDDVPYTMRLPDGRTVFVAIPAEWCGRDVSGETTFTVEAVRLLDRIRVLALRTPKTPTPGHILTLREALGLTQVEFGERIGVDSMTVSRWERGTVKPGPVALKKLEALRRAATRRGVLVAA